MSHHNKKIFIAGRASKDYQENYDSVFRKERKIRDWHNDYKKAQREVNARMSKLLQMIKTV